MKFYRARRGTKPELGTDETGETMHKSEGRRAGRLLMQLGAKAGAAGRGPITDTEVERASLSKGETGGQAYSRVQNLGTFAHPPKRRMNR